MTEAKRASYTAAGSYPLKVLLDKELVESIEKHKRILPVHIQLNPENRCTRDCSWCSCSNRNKKLSMPYEQVIEVMTKFKKLGAKSVTITGGGEPLCHPRINDIIKGIYDLGIKIGLVTNADLIKKLRSSELEKIVWMRISLGDEVKINNDYWSNLEEVVQQAPSVDWSFSYVVASNKPDFELIEKMVNFANEYNFTHIRLVNDIFNANKINKAMPRIKAYLKRNHIDDRLCIYQDRGSWTKGTKQCYISLLKPVVTADGKLGPCCGEQYRTAKPTRDYIADWGTVKDIDKIWSEQLFYDGSKCVKCYYQNYNRLLSTLLKGIKHKEFV